MRVSNGDLIWFGTTIAGTLTLKEMRTQEGKSRGFTEKQKGGRVGRSGQKQGMGHGPYSRKIRRQKQEVQMEMEMEMEMEAGS